MRYALLAIAFGSLTTFARADDWPQFRGPDRTGISKEKGLLKVWPKEGPKLVWTFKDAGIGFSSVAVVKGVVYTLGTDAEVKDEYIIALDEKKGTELWRVKIDTLYTYKGNTYGDGPRSTPTVDGNCLYALSGNGQLVCVDVTKKGKEVWRKHLIKDLGGVMMDRYGVSESVLIDGKHLICTPGGPKGTLAALDKATGKEIWRSDLKHTAPFASVVIAEIDGKKQYIQTSYDATTGAEFGAISGFDPMTGKVVWTEKIFTGTNDSNGIGTTPLVLKNQVYASSVIGGCHLFEIKGNKATELYKRTLWNKVKNAHGGLVLIDGSIYGHDGKAWACQDMASGAINWGERTALLCNSGSIVCADGKLILYTDDGTVGLIDVDPKNFKLNGSVKLPQRSVIAAGRATSRMALVWAHPVIANGHLYVRDNEFIYVYKVK